MKKKLLSVLLVICMVLTLMPMAALADFADTDGHWGKNAIDRWAAEGVLNGKGDGVFDPNGSMTRAEFAQMLCNLMGYTKKAPNTFTDVPSDAWYADAILKLVQAGVLNGVGNNMAAPNAPITREMAAVMLCRAFNLKTSNASMGYADANAVSDWASGAVAALTEMGMMHGVGDNQVAPQLNIDRASVATLIDNMVAEYVTEDKTITGEVNGIILVADGAKVTLEDATLSAPVIVAPAAEGAEVALTGTTAAEDVVVAAEGASVTVGKDASAETVTAAAEKAEVKVEGKVDAVAVTEAAEGAKTTVGKDAEVKDITVAAPKAETEVAGKVESVAVAEAAEGAKTTVGKDAEVKDITVAAPKAETEVSGKVENVVVEETAAGAEITANKDAKIDSVTSSAEDVKVSGSGEVGSFTAEGGSANVTTPGTEIKGDAADDVTTKPETGTSSGGSSGGSDKPSTPTESKYIVSIPSSFPGGKVTADKTEASTANTTVTLTVTPDKQNGETMPYVLKSLTVTKPETAPEEGDEDASTQADEADEGVIDLTEAEKTGKATFKMDKEGTYTVKAEFVQPITKAELFIAEDATSLSKMEGYGYPSGNVTADSLKNFPYLVIAMTRAEGYQTSSDKTSAITLTPSTGSITSKNASWLATGIWSSSEKAWATCYVNTKPNYDSNDPADCLLFTGDSCTFTAKFKFAGADYELFCSYVSPSATAVTLTFKNGNTDYATVKGVANGKVKAPAAPTAAEGKEFVGWQKGEETVKAGAEITVSETGTYTAVWKNTEYSINVKSVTGGTITAVATASSDEGVPTTKNKAYKGNTVTLTLEPNAEYEVAEVSVEGKSIEAKNDVYSFEMPASDVAVSAVFKKITYNVTVNSTENGTATASVDKAAKGDKVTITATPNDGYELDKIEVKQGDNNVSVSNNKFTMPSGAVTVTVTFKQKVAAITLSWGNEAAAKAVGVDVAIKGTAATITADKAKFNDITEPSKITGLYHAGTGNDTTNRLYACIGFTVPTTPTGISKFDIVITGGNQTGAGYKREDVELSNVGKADMDNLTGGAIGDWFGFAVVNNEGKVEARNDITDGTPWTVTISWKGSDGKVIAFSTFTVSLNYKDTTPETTPETPETPAE